MTRPKHMDLNQLAKRILDEATGDEPKHDPYPENVAGQRAGGVKGGPARAAKLSPEERAAIAKKAASARWHKQYIYNILGTLIGQGAVAKGDDGLYRAKDWG